MADFITAVLLSCKVKRCAKMDHESLKLTIRHLYNPDGKAGQIRPDNSPCKRDYTSDVCLPQGIYLSGEEGDASGNWTRERGRGETNYSKCPCRNQVQIQEPILFTEGLLEVLNERILHAAKSQDCSMKVSP